jgi:N-acetylmuramoyl-L-alanine amidase
MAKDTDNSAPQGDGDYVVDEGECLNSIARAAGFYWETLWNHPKNAVLKAARKDHNILLPGDCLFIPPLQRKQESCSTDKRHSFKVKGVPSKIKIQLLDHNKPDPYANQKYRVVVDGEPQEGTVDAQGCLEMFIDPGARTAMLTVGGETFNLAISGLNPIDSVSGAKQRLAALGFYLEGDVEEEWGEAGRDAVKRFQSAHVLENNDEAPSGEYDSKTRAKLAEVYGC